MPEHKSDKQISTKVTDNRDPFLQDAEDMIALVNGGAMQQTIADWLREFGGEAYEMGFHDGCDAGHVQGHHCEFEGHPCAAQHGDSGTDTTFVN